MKRKTLILSGTEIKKIVNIKEAIKAVEEAFRCLGNGKVEMPPKLYINLPKYKGDFRAMPAYVDGLDSCGVKWVNVHPENKKRDLPTVMAILILSDPKDGFPLCVMDATYSTALRTGAAGGVAAKYLARKDSNKIAVIGCGVQAQTQVLALDEIFNIKKANIWGKTPGQSKGFIKRMGRSVDFKMTVAGTIEDCLKGCDIIVTTTPSRRPLIRSEWLKEGVHINAIGADAGGKKELELNILKGAKIVVDAWDQAAHSGEINVPVRNGELSREDIYANIGEIVTGKKKARVNEQEITVFDSTGLAIQDVALASVIYKKAKRYGKGKSISFI